MSIHSFFLAERNENSSLTLAVLFRGSTLLIRQQWNFVHLPLPSQRSKLDMWAQLCWSTIIHVLIFHLCYLIFRHDTNYNRFTLTLQVIFVAIIMGTMYDLITNNIAQTITFFFVLGMKNTLIVLT